MSESRDLIPAPSEATHLPCEHASLDGTISLREQVYPPCTIHEMKVQCKDCGTTIIIPDATMRNSELNKEIQGILTLAFGEEAARQFLLRITRPRTDLGRLMWNWRK